MMWHCGNFEFDTRQPVVMGILNVTPDSFSDGGEHNGYAEAVEHARAMVEAGAAIIDVGGESTRPGSAEVTPEEELSRVIDVVRALVDLGYCVSIDTRHADVARACVQAGAAIINDVSGFRDPAMVEVAASCDAGLVVMHMQGEPGTMQDNPHYDDVVAEVKAYLAEQAAMLEAAGVAHGRICLDPGPGFGKTVSQTVELMRNFHELRRLGYPTMVAVSRKSYIGAVYGIENPADRDVASAAEALLACELGASVVRTHNVEKTLEGLKDLRPYAVIGMGSNVALVANPGEETEGKIANLQQAISGICTIPDTQIIDISSYYESEPAYYEDQDTFVNAVMVVRTGVPPRELLNYLHAIENSLGRVRTIENGPRTLDLDIEDYQMYLSDVEELMLPHPHVCERDFVVKPLLEILPGHILADGTPVTFDDVSYGAARKIER
ncbi:Dihydropteroate synthase [Slackia heliotrinireducens]|uniref:Dihydropteroate synthase/2-amino-4-hydroxy-6-hydroxymethyldihydropteridine pyrophosphokinase n=1 Tax=Slackia heliotrinireducens (strain ATCC 29202 / DSM 20476 / NCTC 11029 / RHS 1) TaxID=471855 RepID=C7N1I2_SLAHD|nr:dihydropteroate synthase [Slackia heliotrinireducens]ACV21274.1 dihydropteroate synthase/2-amino-4-hydroxy-6-hydroxymethyldihydropteridine pyrophosphokinase [Slackia heliotrinireducens DSM 20476]VEG98709.1 Dihydropteroate synthase [Slackia heliotrinireducens]